MYLPAFGVHEPLPCLHQRLNMIPSHIISADSFSFEGLLRAGDHVVCGQACAEPISLTKKLVSHCRALNQPVSVFVGALFSSTFDSSPESMKFSSYGAIGRASVIADKQGLDIICERYSRLASLFAKGSLKADVVLLQAAMDATGKLSFGLASDYVIDAARKARVVVAEINSLSPWTYGTPWPEDIRIDQWVHTELPPVVLSESRINSVIQAIVENVASIVPNGATLQVGVGAIPDAALDALKGHHSLGLHSGVLGDAGTRLIHLGVIDNSRKEADKGISVANTLCASLVTYRFANLNPQIEIRHTRFTHSADILSQFNNLYAINGALEVDLSGQVNCEQLQGRQLGGIGGLLDFARAARESTNGRSITVLPASSTLGGHKISRIVSNLNERPATISRADVDVVITEFGTAYLRDVSIAERARRLIAIADPDFRDELTSELQNII